MKYIDVRSVVESYKGFQDSMTNKSWGYLALLKGCNDSIRPLTPYEVNMDTVSNFLEGIFNLSQTKRKYSGGRSLYVVFSNKWENYFNDQGRYSPNIYDVAVWAYRRKAFPDDITEEKIISEFSNEFNIPYNVIKDSFNTSSKRITFANTLYSESILKTELGKIGVDVSKNNIDSKKGGVVAAPGEISRGPFVQTLYAGLDITDYVLILQSNYNTLYGGKTKTRENEIVKPIRAIGDSTWLPYLTAIRTKPFLLLAGISGTGKSRIVRKLAQATDDIDSFEKDEDRWKLHKPANFELIQVKPNWHNSMDVVGFQSNIPEPHYEFTPFVDFVVKAWCHEDTPFFLCLDEMNLAPVEEYFAEFLSAIESRSVGEDGEFETDPIIKPFDSFGTELSGKMMNHYIEMGYDLPREVEERLRKKGLTLPKNLIVMGTVNMDETTFSFSRKVLDRAMSIEMNEVNYDDFIAGKTEYDIPLLTAQNGLLVNRPISAQEVKEGIESQEVMDFLKGVNDILDGTPFKLGYRVANEAMLYVAADKQFGANNLKAALDNFTLMKILSRIEGDDSKLVTQQGDKLLDKLYVLLSSETVFGSLEKSKSLAKLSNMQDTLKRDHFVSFWG